MGTNVRGSTLDSEVVFDNKVLSSQRQTIQKAGRPSEQPLHTKPCNSLMTTRLSASQTARSPLHGCQRRRTRRAPGRRRRVRLRLSRASQQSLLCIDFIWKSHSSRCDGAAGCCKQHAAAGSPVNLLHSAADHAPVHAASFGQVDNLGPFSLYISSRHSIKQVQLHACLEQDM